MVAERKLMLFILRLENLEKRGVIDRYELEITEDHQGNAIGIRCIMKRGNEKDKDNYREFGFDSIDLFNEILANGELENFYFMK